MIFLKGGRGGKTTELHHIKWERNSVRLPVWVHPPLLLTLWLQFPLLYCNPRPGISYNNTPSVGLERTLTSKGFSREAIGSLLSRACPRQQKQEPLNLSPNCQITLLLRTSGSNSVGLKIMSLNNS